MLGITRKVIIFTIITSVCWLQVECSRLKKAIVDPGKNFENGKNGDHGGELASIQEIIK